MSFDRIKRRWRALFRREEMDHELDAELRFHLERDEAENIDSGMSAEDAHYAALKTFGGVEQSKEESRDARGVRLIEEFWQDLRYGARMLLKRSGFTLVVVITLALGIGANTAVFSLVDAFLFKVLPVKDPERLVFVQATLPRGRTTTSFPTTTFEELRDHNHSFSDLFAWDDTPVSVTLDGQPELVAGDFVSGNYFDVLGVSAVQGRTFAAVDDQPGRNTVAVISYDYWKRRFAEDQSAVGKTISVGRVPLTVIGVTSSDFHGREVAGKSADVVIPMSLQSQLALRDHNTFQIMARLKPNIGIEQARADLDVIYQQILTQSATEQISPRTQQVIREQRIVLRPGLRGSSRPDFAAELPIVFAVVGVVLLITCVNVGNLLSARAAARQKEIAMRLSLGASRFRLIRQLLTESVLLAMLGGIVGLVLAKWGARILLAIFSNGRDSIPFELRPNARILIFTGGVSALTGILFGLIPALTTTKVDLNSILKGTEGRSEFRPGRRLMAKLLVVAQVALSVALLIGAGLLIRTIRHLHEVDTGFNRDQVLTMWVYPSLIGYDHERETRLYRELLDKITAVPGVQAASLSRYSLITGGKGGNIVGPRFFETVGIRVVDGREFTAADKAETPKVAILSERIARDLFPNHSPVDQFLPDDTGQLMGGDIQVVGVVKDIRHRLRQTEEDGEIYLPYTQVPPQRLGQVKLFVHTTGNPNSIVSMVRREVQSTDKDLALRDIQTLAEEMNGLVGGEQSLATLLSCFGMLALALASIGLYGTMSYAVDRRTKELGIRLALGAQRKGVLWMVLREALVQTVIGVVLGIPLAWAAIRLIASLLFGVQSTDPVTISISIVLMMATALIAGYLPARRATKINPLEALRYE